MRVRKAHQKCDRRSRGELSEACELSVLETGDGHENAHQGDAQAKMHSTSAQGHVRPQERLCCQLADYDQPGQARLEEKMHALDAPGAQYPDREARALV